MVEFSLPNALVFKSLGSIPAGCNKFVYRELYQWMERPLVKSPHNIHIESEMKGGAAKLRWAFNKHKRLLRAAHGRVARSKPLVTEESTEERLSVTFDYDQLRDGGFLICIMHAL
jgi:hypothetical protein